MKEYSTINWTNRERFLVVQILKRGITQILKSFSNVHHSALQEDNKDSTFACQVQSERQKWDMILSTQQKRKRTRSLRHWDLGTCGIAVLPSARSCSEIITEGRQKKKSCLTKMKIFTVKDYFLISVPAIQSDFLNVDITIICLVL